VNSVAEAIAVIRGADYDARHAAERFLVAHASLDELAQFIDDADWKVRLFTVRAVAQLPGPAPSALWLLQSRLAVEQDDWVINNLRWGVRNHSVNP
jgi:hypothetical protein